jgi:hypothetical protein
VLIAAANAAFCGHVLAKWVERIMGRQQGLKQRKGLVRQRRRLPLDLRMDVFAKLQRISAANFERGLPATFIAIVEGLIERAPEPDELPARGRQSLYMRGEKVGAALDTYLSDARTQSAGGRCEDQSQLSESGPYPKAKAAGEPAPSVLATADRPRSR